MHKTPFEENKGEPLRVGNFMDNDFGTTFFDLVKDFEKTINVLIKEVEPNKETTHEVILHTEFKYSKI